MWFAVVSSSENLKITKNCHWEQAVMSCVKGLEDEIVRDEDLWQATGMSL